jgi:hypothetical protein
VKNPRRFLEISRNKIIFQEIKEIARRSKEKNQVFAAIYMKIRTDLVLMYKYSTGTY